MKRPSRRQLGLWLLVGAVVVLGARPLYQNLTRPPVRYTVRVVGAEGVLSNVFALNNRGEILGLIGLSLDSVYYFVERDGQITRIPGLENDYFARAINDRGDILAVYMGHYSEREDGQRPPDLLIRSGKAEPLVAFGRPLFSRALAEDGTVIGNIRAAPEKAFQAVVWRNGHAARVSSLTSASGFSENGAILGVNGGKPVVWRNSKAVVLPVLPGWDKGTPEAINNRGQITGTCWRLDRARIDEAPDPSEDPRACLWEKGAVRDLGAIENESWAEDINEQGQAVGHCLVRPLSMIGRLRGVKLPCATLFEDGKALDLNLLIPPRSGWVLRGAKAINDKGQILGIGRYKGQERGFVLTPVKMSE